jgi:omega-6 fatty acid desaturase (delta-12 desaturase)
VHLAAGLGSLQAEALPMSTIDLPESPPVESPPVESPPVESPSVESTSITNLQPDLPPTPDTTPTPGVKEVRSNFIEKDRQKSTFKGFMIFIIPAMIYVAAFVGLLRTSGWIPKLFCAAIVAACIDMLFLIGHDACHQALTPNVWLNRIIGRLAFLPSLHPFSQWDHGHNSLHHGWTNVRGWDPTFVPFSKSDYDQLSPLRRWMERMYRTFFGVGFYYLIENWGKYAVAPDTKRLPKVRKRITTIDRLMVMMVLFGRANTLAIHSALLANLALIGFGFVIPFLFWNWSMGFVVFQHHTHPEVPWFGDREDWTFFAAQVGCVVHVELPRPIELFLHNILDHTAHHVDPKIPLYNLPDAQKRLEAAYPEQIKIVPWTFGNYFHTLKTCRLYDYDTHQWLDYDGTPTSEPIHFHGKPAVTAF